MRRKRLTLIREPQKPQWTNGVLLVGSTFVCHTMEPGSEDAVSPIIDPGFYLLEPHGWEPETQLKFKRTWALVGQDVSHQPEAGTRRAAILLHAGNVDAQTRGCILVGISRSVSGSCLIESRVALEKLRDIIGNDEAFLTIIRG
jgi:hypothetical protein